MSTASTRDSENTQKAEAKTERSKIAASKKPSLRRAILLSVVTMALVMALFLSFIAGVFFLDSFHFIHQEKMQQVAKEVDVSDGQPQLFINYHIASRWADVPQPIRERFSATQPLNHLDEIFEDWQVFSPPGRAYLLLKTTGPDQQVRYVSSIKYWPDPQQGPIKHKFWLDPMVLIAFSGISATVIFTLLFVLMLRRLGRPIDALYQWAQALSLEALPQRAKDFRYRELNSLANIIFSSLQRADDTLKREQEFLQYASHELRTPIAVMRSNSALLNKVSPNPSPQEEAIRQRIDRAGLTMKGMSETLLWLTREHNDGIHISRFYPGEQLRQLHQDLAYLLQGKAVTVEINCDDYHCDLPVEAARILLTNLIRNAFQHCAGGRIIISQQNNSVTIRNQHDKGDETAGADMSGDVSNDATGSDNNGEIDAGFGLGLKLCDKLSQRFNWPLHSEKSPEFYAVSVTFQPLAPEE